MSLETLLTRLERGGGGTPGTPSEISGVPPKPAQTVGWTPGTHETPQKTIPAAPAKFDAESVTEAFAERAAILEYDAGLEREQAEHEAWRILLRDGTLMTCYYDPPMTRAQVVAAVADVADLEPVPPAEADGELSRQDEAHLRAWLALIGETDERMICAVLEQCRGDGDALAYYLNLARKRP